jgi:stage V sporulation protein G
VFDDVFVVKGLKIIERPGDKKRLLTMPSRLRSDGSHEDVAHPIRPDFREVLADAIFSEFDRQQSATDAAER